MTLICHCNECSDRRREEKLIDGVVVCRLSCSAQGILKCCYGKVQNLKRVLERKDIRVNIGKTKGIQLLYGKKTYALKVDPCYFCGKRVKLYSVRRIECQKWVNLCCLDVPRQVSLLSSQDVFVCRMCLGHNYLVKENIEPKRGKAILGEVGESLSR